jgi:hypothetical protein
MAAALISLGFIAPFPTVGGACARSNIVWIEVGRVKLLYVPWYILLMGEFENLEAFATLQLSSVFWLGVPSPREFQITYIFAFGKNRKNFWIGQLRCKRV